MSKISKNSPSTQYITRRIRDAEGNIIVKRYKKRANSIPLKIPWNRMPSIILGSFSGSYAYIINQYNNSSLINNSFLPEISDTINSFLNSIEGIASLFLTGSFAVGLGTLLGYALITQGFRVKKWGAAARQLIAIGALLLFSTAVFSSFINEAGISRHLDSTQNFDGDFDLDGLESPFYSQLLESLLDLMQPIPNPSEIVAVVEPNDGIPLNKLEDTYLWRWKVAETYNPIGRSFDIGYDELITDYSGFDPATPIFDETEGVRKFKVSQQYLCLTNSYSDGLLTPWHSVYESVNSIESFGVTPNNALEGQEVNVAEVNLQKDLNSRPIVDFSLTESRSTGRFEFDTLYIPEFQEQIAKGSISYSDMMQGMLNDQYKSDLEQFNSRRGPAYTEALNEINNISSIYGAESLPNYYDENVDATEFGNANVFNEKISSFKSRPDQSVFSLILNVHNEVQNAILNLLTNPTAAEALEGTSQNGDAFAAPEGNDRAFYFWQQVKNNQFFGLEDFYVGYVNMLRALNIPARVVIGFNTGDVNEESNSITIKLGDIVGWIEALIPWVDDNGNIQLSWAIFNPLPKLSLINEGRFVYGKNSMGAQPTLDLSVNSGETTSVGNAPNDIQFTLGQMNTKTNFSARLFFEDTPAPGQEIELTLLNEDQIDSLQGAGAIDALNSGTQLTPIITSEDDGAWANFSISVFTDSTGEIEFNGQKTPIDQKFGFFQPNEPKGGRNIYALVARYGLEFQFVIIGWQLDANLALSLLDGPNSVTFSEVLGSTEVVNSYVSEVLDYTVLLSSPEGDLISDVNVQLLWLSPTALSEIDEIIAEQSTADYLIDEGLTDENGAITFENIITLANTDELIDPLRIYTILAWVENTLIYDYIQLYLSEDFQIGYEILEVPNPLDRFVLIGQSVDWDLDISANFTNFLFEDEIFSPLSETSDPVERRTPLGLELNYYLITQDEKNRIEEDEALNYISDTIPICSSSYDAQGQACYILEEGNSDFGVTGGTISDENHILHLTNGIITPNTYYLLIELIYPTLTGEFSQIVYLNGEQKMGFQASDAVPLSLKNSNQIIFPNFETDLDDFDHSNDLKINQSNVNYYNYNYDYVQNILIVIFVITIPILLIKNKKYQITWRNKI